MRAIRRAVGWAVALAVAASLALLGWSWARRHPQDLPWAPLDLAQPIGLATGRKLAALRGDFPQCRALLDRAGVRYTRLPVLETGEARCGYADGVHFVGGGARRIGFYPAGLALACPVAAALALWEWDVVQPAARAHFGQEIATIEQLGSYNCRRIAGSGAGSWSEHATANAIDVAAFVLTDGTRISVARDWADRSAKAAFLRDVHDGACRLFATVLGPDYNAAHRDHFHLDQADRALGWRVCR